MLITAKVGFDSNRAYRQDRSREPKPLDRLVKLMLNMRCADRAIRAKQSHPKTWAREGMTPNQIVRDAKLFSQLSDLDLRR